jgi:enoyl-CoA hydratase/carnithine racemase
MSEIITERSGSVLRIQFNRPEKKNALTMNMYTTVADLLNTAENDDGTRAVILHGAGDGFTAGNDLGDFLNHPLKEDDSPQARFIDALMNFDKPLIAAVHGAAVGSGTTMLKYCDFVHATESTVFQMPFVNVGLVTELGTSYSIPAQIGYVAAAELILLALPFDARRGIELGFVTRIVSKAGLLPTAMETALRLVQQPAGALLASKKLMRQFSHERLAAAVKAEAREYAARLQSPDAKEAMTAFFEKRRPDFTKASKKT